MKVYQLIYTATKYSLSDSSLNLENSPGYKVYSCTQGLTDKDIEEVICFCGYKKPDKCDIEYSKEYADASVPELFPKTFRTLRLESGKYAAIQAVFSGYDMNGNDGNYFAHALIFDEVYDGFEPEAWYGSEAFRSFLAEEEKETSLVRFLPKLNSVSEHENLAQWLDLFIKEHKIQMSFLVEKAVEVLTGGEHTHLCICASDQEESDYYVLSLKRLLPRSIVLDTGISTNNTYLPSAKQTKILFNATISGYNNITDEMIEQRKNCIYVNFENEHPPGVVYERLFEMSNDELQETYDRLGIMSVQQFEGWLISYNRINEQGISERLLKLKQVFSSEVFAARCMELYDELERSDMLSVRFEILNVMYDHSELFGDIWDDVTLKYVKVGLEGILNGDPVNMENLFRNSDRANEKAVLIYEHIDEYMKMIDEAEVGEQQSMLLLRLFSIIKQSQGSDTWREFFKDNHDYLSIFVELAANVIIYDTSPITFVAPIIWTSAELSEIVAYIDSSTDDDEIKKACRKFILSNVREAWDKYGIQIIQQEKNREDREGDIIQIRKLLGTVGYVPFQRGRYQDIKYDVTNDINTNDNPLLLTRFLNAFYEWQMTKQEAEAKQCALEIQALIIEMREKEFSCYEFVFPKLALEMLSTPGLYHEIIINCDTMQDTFWNWFLIGADKNLENDFVFQNYEHVFKANEPKLKKLAIYIRLKKYFKLKRDREDVINEN